MTLKNNPRRLWLPVLIAAIVGMPIPAGAMPPAQTVQSHVEIMSPTDNQEIGGMVQIVGTAVDPAFYQYELAYATEPVIDDAWAAIQPPIAQQVIEGVLGAWDSTQVPDGIYRLRLRLVQQDGSTIDDHVRVQIINATPTPLPTPLPTFTPTLLPSTATPGPSPTPLIWQPPTRTPRPTETPGGPTPTPRPVSLEDSPFHPSRLRQAAWTGVMITIGVFGFLAIYSLMRAAFRRQLRNWWWRFRREVINPMLDSHGRKRKRKRR
ncbi:MAG: hypothetical protein JXB07_10430 [Anaerolineae bacterium]|nr:hypothetical protein [Anaerolineae bacterium]